MRWSVLLAATCTACAADVIVDVDGEGGSNAGGAGDPGTPDIEAAAAEACEFQRRYFRACYLNCLNWAANAYEKGWLAGCEEEADAWVSCHAIDVERLSCSVDQGNCDSELKAYHDCVDPYCREHEEECWQ